MFKKLVPVVAAAAMLAGAYRSADANVIRRHGSLCAPKYGSQNLVGADERGTYNASPTTVAQVTCAVVDRVAHKVSGWVGWDYAFTVDETPSIKRVAVWGRDLSATTPFSCYLFSTDEDGFSSWAPTKYMCSDNSGCPDSTSEYTGVSRMSWDTSWPVVDSYEDYVGIVCRVPPATSLGASYVKAIKTLDGEEVHNWQDPDTWRNHPETLWF